jgi:hypothetical protein
MGTVPTLAACCLSCCLPCGLPCCPCRSPTCRARFQLTDADLSHTSAPAAIRACTAARSPASQAAVRACSDSSPVLAAAAAAVACAPPCIQSNLQFVACHQSPPAHSQQHPPAQLPNTYLVCMVGLVGCHLLLTSSSVSLTGGQPCTAAFCSVHSLWPTSCAHGLVAVSSGWPAGRSARGL